jgi:hypothetical protein
MRKTHSYVIYRITKPREMIFVEPYPYLTLTAALYQLSFRLTRMMP